MIKEVVDFIIGDELMEIGSEEHLTRLYNELVGKDWFMTFRDMEDYFATKERTYADYEDSKTWAKKMLVNTTMAGFFSSDRTIAEYNKDIIDMKENGERVFTIGGRKREIIFYYLWKITELLRCCLSLNCRKYTKRRNKD